MKMTKNWRHREIDWDKKENEYYKTLYCDNCRKEINIFIKKGITIKGVLSEVECPNCGIIQNRKRWD